MGTIGERKGGESAKAFHAFTLYRDLPAAGRSLRTVSQKLGKSKTVLDRWSRQYEWVRRVRAWDEEQERTRCRVRFEEWEATGKRQARFYQTVSQIYLRPLLELESRCQAHPGCLDQMAIAELMRAGAAALPILRAVNRDQFSSYGDPQPMRPKVPKITEGLFCWVQSACRCGHLHDQHDPHAPDRRLFPCTVDGCSCQKFVEPDVESSDANESHCRLDSE